MATIRNVLVIGAGGRLGPSVLKALNDDSRFNVSVLTRQSSTSTFPDNLSVHRISDDYPEAELLEALKGQDAVVSTMATINISTQKAIIDAAVKSGVKRFIPSEFGSDTRNENGLALLPQYFEGKVQTVTYLRSKEKEGLSWSAFFTGCVFELAVQFFMGFDIKERKAVIFNDGSVRWSATSMSTVGLAVKNALLTPDKTANRYLPIDSFTVSMNEILASLERCTNSTWETSHVDAEEQKAVALQKIAQGDKTGFNTLIRYICNVEGYGGNTQLMGDGANDLLSLPKEDLDNAVAHALK